MRQCWTHDPGERLSFKQVLGVLDKMLKNGGCLLWRLWCGWSLDLVHTHTCLPRTYVHVPPTHTHPTHIYFHTHFYFLSCSHTHYPLTPSPLTYKHLHPDSLEKETESFLGQKEEWKKEIDDKLETLKTMERTLHSKEEELKKVWLAHTCTHTHTHTL